MLPLARVSLPPLTDADESSHFLQEVRASTNSHAAPCLSLSPSWRTFRSQLLDPLRRDADAWSDSAALAGFSNVSRGTDYLGFASSQYISSCAFKAIELKGVNQNFWASRPDKSSNRPWDTRFKAPHRIFWRGFFVGVQRDGSNLAGVQGSQQVRGVFIAICVPCKQSGSV